MRFDKIAFSPGLIRARWDFGKLPSEELPTLAQDALEHGYDGKFTRQIAGLLKPHWSELRLLVPRFLAELGSSTPLNKAEAGIQVARFVTKAIVEGSIEPYEGARYIWREIVSELWHETPQELLCFLGNASEYEDCHFYSDHPEDVRRTIEQAIIEDAKSLASGL